MSDLRDGEGEDGDVPRAFSQICEADRQGKPEDIAPILQPHAWRIEKPRAETKVEEPRIIAEVMREMEERQKGIDEERARTADIPPPLSFTNDLANLHRMVRYFGNDLRFLGNCVFKWVDTHWKENAENELTRCVEYLPQIIAPEAKEERRKVEAAADAENRRLTPAEKRRLEKVDNHAGASGVDDHRNQSRCDHVKLSRAGCGFRGWF